MRKRNNGFANTVWKVLVIFIGIAMVLGMVLPFLAFTQ